MVTLTSTCKTPASNTGLIPHPGFQNSIDTLTLVLRKVRTVKCAIAIKDMVNAAFSEQIDFDPECSTFMMKRWDGCSTASLRGVMLHWMNPTEEDAGILRLHLPGKAIAAAGQKELYDCAQVLWTVYGGNCSRVDVASDDYGKITNLDDIRSAQELRNYTGVRSHRWAGSGSLNESDGLTYYFGSKSSDSQLRVYDKERESKGKVDCIRWELQLRRSKANELCNIWLGGGAGEYKAMASIVSGAICGAVDFIDRSRKQKDLSRCSRLPWWSRVRACMGKAFRVAPKKKEPLLMEKMGWLCESVMPSLAVVKSYLGDASFWQFLENEVQDRLGNLKPKQRRLVHQARLDDVDICKETPWSRARLSDFIDAQKILEFG